MTLTQCCLPQTLDKMQVFQAFVVVIFVFLILNYKQSEGSLFSSSCQAEKEELENKLTACDSKLAKVEEELRVLKRESKKCQDAKKLAEENAETLKKDLDSLSKKYDEQVETDSDLRELLRTEQERATKYENAFKTSENKLSSANKDLESARLADIGEIIVGIVIILATWGLMMSKKSVDKDKDELNKQLEQAADETKALKTELDQTNVDLEVSQKVSHALKNTLAHMAQNLRRGREQLSIEEKKLEDEIAEVQRCAEMNKRQGRDMQHLLRFALQFKSFCEDNHLVEMTQWADGKELKNDHVSPPSNASSSVKDGAKERSAVKSVPPEAKTTEDEAFVDKKSATPPKEEDAILDQSLNKDASATKEPSKKDQSQKSPIPAIPEGNEEPSSCEMLSNISADSEERTDTPSADIRAVGSLPPAISREDSFEVIQDSLNTIVFSVPSMDSLPSTTQ